MTLRTRLGAVLQRERINFLLTNRLPRRHLSRFVGWFSRIEHPWICRLSIAVWRLFADLELHDAKKDQFDSLHDCFVRELRAGARPVCSDPQRLVSPCDAIVGASGRVHNGTVLQAKGYPYQLSELLGDAEAVRYYRNGSYATLRLTAGMYHRFHAPYTCRVERITHVPGDHWNVNPTALKRVERLFCRNERAIIRCALPTEQVVTLVPIAAILVGGIRLNFLEERLNSHRYAARVIPCRAQLSKGQEMGWFEHGSTIIVFAPEPLTLCANVREGARLRMGEPLLSLPDRE